MILNKSSHKERIIMKKIKPNHYIDTVVYDLDQALTCFKLRAFQYFSELNLELTSEQFNVLDTIYCNDGICQRDLSKLILKDRSNTTRILIVLEEQKFIKRVAGKKNNHPVKQLFITEKGKIIIDNNISKIKTIFPAIFADISEQELIIFKKTIKKLKNDLLKDIIIKI